jgi:hypothetical protein
MVDTGTFCIDRWELVTVDSTTGQKLSPYYPPHDVLLARVRAVWQAEADMLCDPRACSLPLPDLPAWQARHRFQARAVSQPSVVPQGYMSYHVARQACERAGKRLCKKEEWRTACRGERGTKFPYGERYERDRCNVWRMQHPAHALHGVAALGHTDPRLNLVVEDGRDPLLRLTGATASCASRWGTDRIYDMVGNLDEWVDDESGVFVGGFYARATSEGCDAEVASHAPAYYDYSTGARCCRALR